MMVLHGIHPKSTAIVTLHGILNQEITLDTHFVQTGKPAGKDYCSQQCEAIGCVAFVHVKGAPKDFYCKLYKLNRNAPLKIEVDKYSGTNDRVWIKVRSPEPTKCIDMNILDFMTSRRLEINNDGMLYGLRQTGPKNYEIYVGIIR
ncbi:unnamed protein product [Caenorhabditis nigoni]